MWYPQKAAFRVGAVSGNKWNKDSIGNYSFATGSNSKALGEYSTSMGNSTTASGYGSTSIGWGSTASNNFSMSLGYETTASGVLSTSLGYQTLANGDISTSMGYQTTASGYNSTSIGWGTTASGYYSTSIGDHTTASGYGSTSMGRQTTASGYYSTSIGYYTLSKAIGSISVGMYNDDADNPMQSTAAATDRIFQIGNGTFSSFKNAITVLRNGNTGIGTTTPSVPLSFANTFGTKISLYHGSYGDVGIGVEGGELRLQNDIPNGKVSMGVIETTGDYTELAKAQRSGAIAFTVNGSLLANGTLYASDERFKQNIIAISSPLKKIQQLNGVEYEMRISEFPQKHFIPGRQIGLIAQNVEKVIPEAVNEMDGYKGVDYGKLVPLLIEGIKEQQKQIESSNDEVEKLKQQVAELKKMVEQLVRK
jgi:hypothetical protein